MENIPTSTIRSLSMGMVEIAGRARQYYDLRAPHSQTPCIFYRCRVYTREYTQSGQRWAEVDETTSGWLPFYVEDNTGRVLVEPKGAVIRIPLRHQSFSSRSMPFFQSTLKNVDTRTIEELLPPGAPVYVVGYAHPVRRDESIRDRLTQRLRLLKKDPVKMARYDHDGDSHIDAHEWDVARADAEREVMAEVLAREHTDAEEIVIGKPPRGRFIIADSEEELLERTAKRLWIYLVGGVAALGCGIWLLALLP